MSEMDTVQRVSENVAPAKTEQPLTAQEAHQLNRLAAMSANYARHVCNQLCKSAARSSVAIADQLRDLMYHESYAGKS